MLLSIFSLNLGTNIYSFIEYTKSEYYIHKLPSTGIISKKESFAYTPQYLILSLLLKLIVSTNNTIITYESVSL